MDSPSLPFRQPGQPRHRRAGKPLAVGPVEPRRFTTPAAPPSTGPPTRPPSWPASPLTQAW